MCGRRVGVRFVEGVDYTDSFDWFLFYAVDVLWRTDTHRFQNRRHDVNHMVKLRADPAGITDVTGPRNRQALSRAAEVGGDLFGPPERRIEGPRPGNRHVRMGLRPAPGVIELELVGDWVV